MSMLEHCGCDRCAPPDPGPESRPESGSGRPGACGQLMDTKYEAYEVWTWPFLGTDLVCWRCALFCWSECAGRDGFMLKTSYPGALDPPDLDPPYLLAAFNAAPRRDGDHLAAALRLASGAA